MLLRKNTNNQNDKEEKHNQCGCDYRCPIHKKFAEEANNNIAFQQEEEKGDPEALQCPRESPPPSLANEEACNGQLYKIPNKIIPIITFHQGEQTVPTWVIVVVFVLILLSIGISELRWHRLIKAIRHPVDK